MIRAKSIFIAALLVVLFSSTVCTAEIYNSDSIQKAAQQIFPGTDPKIRFILETELFTKGMKYRTFQAFSSNQSLGFFTQVVLRQEGRETVNAVFRVKSGKIIRAAAVEPLRFKVDGSSFKEVSVQELTDCFQGIELQRFGASASALFQGLRYLPQLFSGELEKRFDEDRKKEPAYPMNVSAPSPALGIACPHFSLTTIDGTGVNPHYLKGKAFVFFAGSYRNAVSSEMSRVLYSILPQVEQKIAFVEVYENPQWFILEQLRRGASFKGLVACDPQKKSFKALSIPYAPYVLCFSKDHVLKEAFPFKGRMTAGKKLREFVNQHSK